MVLGRNVFFLMSKCEMIHGVNFSQKLLDNSFNQIYLVRIILRKDCFVYVYCTVYPLYDVTQI